MKINTQAKTLRWLDAGSIGRAPVAATHAPGLANHEPEGAPPMNAVASLLSPEDILLDMDASTKRQVFEDVGRLLERRYGVAQARVIDGLGAREKLGSTALGQGVALPHARVKGLSRALAAFVRPHLPIPFDAPDGKPVSDILVLLVPEHATGQHLQILAEVAQMFCDRPFREQLRLCGNAGDVCRLFADWSGH